MAPLRIRVLAAVAPLKYFTNVWMRLTPNMSRRSRHQMVKARDEPFAMLPKASLELWALQRQKIKPPA